MRTPPLSWSLAFLMLAGTVHMFAPDAPLGGEALFYAGERVSVPDGTLIRAEGDERVYLAIDDRKRWIDSERTFQLLGFRPEEVRVVSATDLAWYPDGEPITAATRIILPSEARVLPDLTPRAPYDLRLSTVGGRAVIRFTGSFWNKGYGPFRLVSENQTSNSADAGSEEVYQYVQDSDGNIRKQYVGTFIWHPAHAHHHYDDFGEYLFEPASLAPGTRLLTPTNRKKTTFCLRDDERMSADIPNVPEQPVFTTCGPDMQGVSPGWIDVYGHYLPDQYVDVQDLPPGVYALSFFLDPRERFIEERGDNNIAATLIELDVARGIMRTVASLAPFASFRNTAADGTLLRDMGTGSVYVIESGRKRWIRSVDIFNSYGYQWNAVYPVTSAMIAGFPDQQLIRRQGTEEVYVLNERGYRRHVVSPAVFASYGWTADDVIDVNDIDFASYGEGALIMRAGDTQVYAVQGNRKRAMGSLAVLQTLHFDFSGLHMVNQVDFDAYAMVESF